LALLSLSQPIVPKNRLPKLKLIWSTNETQKLTATITKVKQVYADRYGLTVPEIAVDGVSFVDPAVGLTSTQPGQRDESILRLLDGGQLDCSEFGYQQNPMLYFWRLVSLRLSIDYNLPASPSVCRYRWSLLIGQHVRAEPAARFKSHRKCTTGISQFFHLPLHTRHAVRLAKQEQLFEWANERNIVTDGTREVLELRLMGFQLRLLQNLPEDIIHSYIEQLGWCDESTLPARPQFLLRKWLLNGTSWFNREQATPEWMTPDHDRHWTRDELEVIESTVRRVHRLQYSLPERDGEDTEPRPLDLSSHQFWRHVAMYSALRFGLKIHPSLLRRLYLTWLKCDRDVAQTNLVWSEAETLVHAC